MVKSHNPCTPPGALTPHGNAIAELVSEGYREGGFFLAARGLCFWGMHAQTLVHPEGWTYAEYPDEVLAAISAAKDNQRMGAALMALGKVHCPRDDHEFEGTDWWAHYLAEYRDEIQQTGVIPDAWRIERDADGDPVLVAVEVVHTQRLTQAKLSAYWRLERILYSDARAALDLRVMYVGAHAHGRAMVSVDLEAGAPA